MRCLLLLLLVGRGLCGVVRVRVRVRPIRTRSGRSERGGVVAKGAWRIRSGLGVELLDRLTQGVLVRAVDIESAEEIDAEKDGRHERTRSRIEARAKRAARRCSRS